MTAVGVALLVSAGCAAGSEAVHTTAAATRPATKHTCPDVRWEPPAGLGVEPTSRELVGFGPTLLGVDTSWAGEGITVRTVAGGYVDDLTEPFDDLTLTGRFSLPGGVDAEVLRGTLREVPVLVVVWREPALEVPCDVHALLAVGVDGSEEAQLLAGLR